MEVGNSRADRLIHTALGALALRQRVIADNVANVSTPGFKASRVDFEASLKAAVLRGAQAAGGVDEVRPQVVTSTNTARGVDGNNVDIDQQMVELAQTNITYNALAQVTSARLRALRSVITGAR
jgi:flagellar basal-body rod protein FlgB